MHKAWVHGMEDVGFLSSLTFHSVLDLVRACDIKWEVGG